MRAAFPELGVQGRIGVNTGEVVTGTEERLATGDAVNVAARLQQAAQPDEVLIGEATLALVRGAVVVEPVEPLELKGKTRAGTCVPAAVGAGGAGAQPREPLRRPGARAGARARGVGAGSRGAALRAAHDRGRGRRRKIAAGRGSARLARCPGRPRPLPPVRRGDHLLAGGRGDQAARLASVRSGRCRLDPLAARRDGGRAPRRRRSPGHSGSCSRSRRRSSSSSTTSSGARRHSSTWSRASRCSRPEHRSCSSAWRAPSSSRTGMSGP